MATDLMENAALGDINKYDFITPSHDVFKAERGLNATIVEQISEMKKEPAWMRKFRLDSLKMFEAKTMPRWGDNICSDFQDIYHDWKST